MRVWCSGRRIVVGQGAQRKGEQMRARGRTVRCGVQLKMVKRIRVDLATRDGLRLARAAQWA